MSKETTTTEKTLVPEIRFEGFSGELYSDFLYNIASFSKGYGYAKKDLRRHGHPVILYGQLYTNYSFTIKEASNFAELKEGSVISKGYEVIIPASGETSEDIARAAAVLQSGVAIGGDLNIISPTKEIDSSYLAMNLSSTNPQKQMANKAQGKSVVHLQNNEIKKVLIHIPGLNEQKKISNFISKIESSIIFKQKELTKLQNFKQAMLQKMFPKEGEKVPEIRFEGFEGEWEESTLGAQGNTFAGLSGKTKEDFGHGDALYIPYTNVFNNAITDIKQLESTEVDAQQNEVKYGDVLFTTSSETPEEVGMSSVWMHKKSSVYLNSFCFGYRPLGTINLKFLAYMLRSTYVRKQFQLLAQGISRYNISKNKAMNIVIFLPVLSEQKQIGDYFYNLDQNIKSKQAELKKLKQFKQAMLSKLFV